MLRSRRSRAVSTGLEDKNRKYRGVLDDDIGSRVDQISKDFREREKEVRDNNRAIDESSIVMAQMIVGLIKEEGLANASPAAIKNNQETLKKRLEKTISPSLGYENSRKVLQGFGKDLVANGAEIAAKNLADNITKESSGRSTSIKLGAFGEAQKDNGLTADKRLAMLRQNRLRPDYSQVKDCPDLSAAMERHEKMCAMRRDGLRQMRKLARSLKLMNEDIMSTSIADNNIGLNDMGMKAAEYMDRALKDLYAVVNMGENMLGAAQSRQDMQVDMLLAKGRTNMMVATQQSKVMRKNLTYQFEQDSERTR